MCFCCGPFVVTLVVSGGAGEETSLQRNSSQQEEAGLPREYTQEATEAAQEAPLPHGTIPAAQDWPYMLLALASLTPVSDPATALQLSPPPEGSKGPAIYGGQPSAPHSHQAIYQCQQANQELGRCHGGGAGEED